MSEETPNPPSPAHGVRASDEDRERLATELRDHSVAGRLDTDELEERLQQTYAARTTGELEALRRDLPATPAALASEQAARRSHLTRRLVQEGGGSAALFAVCTVIWLASGANGQFWPIWVAIVFLLSLVRNGWALFGPAPDLEAVERDLNRRREHRLERGERRSRRRLDR
jgi:Domain of unknown function (DUF1707)